MIDYFRLRNRRADFIGSIEVGNRQMSIGVLDYRQLGIAMEPTWSGRSSSQVNVDSDAGYYRTAQLKVNMEFKWILFGAVLVI